jgi:hypothetical protein
MPTWCEGDAELRTLGDLEVSRSLGELVVCEGANTLKVAGAGLVVKAVIEQAKVRKLFFSHTIGSTKILLRMVHIFGIVGTKYREPLRMEYSYDGPQAATTRHPRKGAPRCQCEGCEVFPFGNVQY